MPLRRTRTLALLVLGLALGAVLVVFAVRPMLARASTVELRAASGAVPGAPGLSVAAAPAPAAPRLDVRTLTEPSAGTSAVELAAPEGATQEAPREPASASTDGPRGENAADEDRTSRDDVSLIARVTGGAVTLRSAPSGDPLVEIGPTTQFGSPVALGVVERQGPWLGVVAPELGNGRIGWIDLREGGVELSSTRLRMEIDLSRRELVLRRGEEVVRRAPVGVGAPSSPTPIGRFAVTDKLRGTDFSPVYGCCIIALSAKQPNLPPGWTGGDRVAIHGTNDPSTIGAATSAGCPHASDEDLRFLMERVPLGTPVVVHP